MSQSSPNSHSLVNAGSSPATPSLSVNIRGRRLMAGHTGLKLTEGLNGNSATEQIGTFLAPVAGYAAGAFYSH